MHEFIQEVEYPVGLGTGDQFDFDPLGELVNGHQNSIESFWRSWKRPNHVKSLAGKRPGWWYGN
jgi:hypothetical protein